MAGKARRRRRHQVGAEPGALNIDPEAQRPVLSVFAFDGKERHECKVDKVDSLRALRERWPVVWLNVDGLGDAQILKDIGAVFGLHPLALEDVVDVRQRPKVENYGTSVFVVLRMVDLKARPITDQMSMFFGEGFVVTFQEKSGDCFDPVRDRLRRGNQRINSGGAVYLAYALIDALIDAYFPILEECGEQMETLQDAVLARPDTATVHRINHLKRDLLTLRRAIWPLRDELNVLLRIDTFAQKEMATYLRDCYDHTLVLIDAIETLRETTGSLMDVYLSSVNNRMNEVMKLLTIIATIFTPLTFITGVYGMNFNPSASPYNMPELNWAWGYPAVLSVMLATVGAFVTLIWRKGWFR